MTQKNISLLKKIINTNPMQSLNHPFWGLDWNASKKIKFVQRMGYYYSHINTPTLVFCQANDWPKERKICQRRGRCWTRCAGWRTGRDDCSEKFHNWALMWLQSPSRCLLQPRFLPQSPPQRTHAETSGHAALKVGKSLKSQPPAHWKCLLAPWRPVLPPDHNYLPFQIGASANPQSFPSSALG